MNYDVYIKLLEKEGISCTKCILLCRKDEHQMPTAWSQCLKWLLRKRSNLLPKYSICRTLIGSLSNDDGDGNENGEKAIGLD